MDIIEPIASSEGWTIQVVDLGNQGLAKHLGKRGYLLYNTSPNPFGLDNNSIPLNNTEGFLDKIADKNYEQKSLIEKLTMKQQGYIPFLVEYAEKRPEIKEYQPNYPDAYYDNLQYYQSQQIAEEIDRGQYLFDPGYF